MSLAFQKMLKKPEYSDKQSKASKKRWAIPDAKENQSKAMKTIWENPEFRKRIGKNHKKAVGHLENRKRASRNMKKIWINPKRREDMSIRFRELWADQGYRAKLSCENSQSWKGGISFEPYHIGFNEYLKKKIRERDNYICGICGKGEAKYIHHINYDKMNSCPTNLITLHNSCHGKTGFDREIWIAFFTLSPLSMIF